jgi:hypothetical protein
MSRQLGIIEGKDVSVSAYINPEVERVLSDTSMTLGTWWRLKLHPNGQKLISNIPTDDVTGSRQHVMNVNTSAWCQFTGWNARDFEVLDGVLLFGDDDGKVWRADVGTDDNGAAIVAECLTAYSSMGAPSSQKRWTMARPIFQAPGTTDIDIGLSVDYRDPAQLYEASPSLAQTPWGSPWGSYWSPTYTVHRGVQGVGGIGLVAALRLKVTTDQDFFWNSVTYFFEVGGVI